MSPEGLETLLSLAAALVAGLLIGFERQQGDRRGLFAGIRTFPLFAIAGALGMLIDVWLLVALALGLGLVVSLAYYLSSQGRSSVGTSTEAAALVTFGLGALCTANHLPLSFSDRLLLVGAGASMVMALLSYRQPLHDFASKVSLDDLYATTKLLLLSVIVLPTLPNRFVGPYEALNPFKIGIFVVLVSAIGFAGYVAIRIAGPARGLGMTGLFGGLASSTAVTLSFSGHARTSPYLVNPCALAITLASSTTFMRSLVYSYTASAELGRAAMLPLVTASCAGFAAAAVLHFRAQNTPESRNSMPPQDLRFKNPLSLMSALKFAFILTAVMVLSHAATVIFSNSGLFVASALAGTINSDAVALSVSRLHERGLLSLAAAVDALGIAILSTTLTKITLAFVLGGKALGQRVAITLMTMVLTGVITRIWVLS